MTKENGSRDRVTKWIRWIARAWSFPMIVIALLVFAGNVWNWVTSGAADPHAVEDYPATEVLSPLFMFLSIVGLGIAWRWERLGGTLAVIFQLAALISLLIQTPITQNFPNSAIPYLLSVVAIIPGILFLVCWRRSK